MKKILGFLLIGYLFLSSCQKEKEDKIYDFVFPMTVSDTLFIGDTLDYMFYITPEFANVKMYLEGPLNNTTKKPGDVFAEHLLDSLIPRTELVLIGEVTHFEENQDNPKYRKFPFSWIPSDELKSNSMYCFSVEIHWQEKDIPLWHWGKYIYMKAKDLDN